MTEEDDKVTILQAQSLTLKTSKNQREKKRKELPKTNPLFRLGVQMYTLFSFHQKKLLFF
jgi:hypothetical protein